MPFPIFAAMFAGQALQLIQARKSVSNQNKIQALNRENITKATGLEYGALNSQARAEAERAAVAVADVARDASLARGNVTAAAADSGVSGASVDALLNDFSATEGRYMTAITLNEQLALANIERQKKSVEIGGSGKLNSSLNIEKPNLMLGLAQAATSAYLAKQTYKAQSGTA